MNKAGDAKTSTPTKYSPPPHHHHRTNNLNNGSPDSILNLQRAIGNQAVQSLMRSSNAPEGFDFAKIGIVQPKLKVSQPGDVYEQEADKVADYVMRMPMHESPDPIEDNIGEEQVNRKCSACEMKEEEGEERKNLTISRKRSSNASLEVPDEAATNEISNIRSSRGSSLDANTKEFMESRFGYDFGDVRIHSGERAASSAESMNALAYTIGNDVVFRQGYYQPNTFEGKRLLAHELTHVVQQKDVDIPNNIDQRANGNEMGSDVPQRLNQSSMGVRVSESTPQPAIQRACDMTEIDTPAGCIPDTGEPIGKLVHFDVNCDTLAAPDYIQPVLDFADSMTEYDEVNVHGFASMDGDPSFNEALSCARAKRVMLHLTQFGVNKHKIHLFQHGPTPGPALERRSAVLELVGGASRPTAVPQITPEVLAGPTPGSCGNVIYEIRWNLSRNSDPALGGFIVQDIIIAWSQTDCAGMILPMRGGRPNLMHYHEAWRVDPGSSTATEEKGIDIFEWEQPDPSTTGFCTTGSVWWIATARYHDGIDALPNHMRTHNIATLAGPLRSSTTDPNLGGNMSRRVPHGLFIRWDCCSNCCPCGPTPTVVVYHVP